MDIRATIGATVEPVAPREQEPDVWEDYVTSYENGRFAESSRYVRSYPAQLPVLQGLLPAVRTPVHIVSGAHDDLVPPSNGRYLAQRLPDSQLSILDTGHFAWEQVPTSTPPSSPNRWPAPRHAHRTSDRPDELRRAPASPRSETPIRTDRSGTDRLPLIPRSRRRSVCGVRALRIHDLRTSGARPVSKRRANNRQGDCVD
jgi:hypothetical protein